MNLFRSYLAKQKNYFIKPNYIPRLQPEYFVHALETEVGFVYQPQIYPFAFFLARRFGCNTIIDIGPGNAEKLILAYPEFQIIGLDFGANLLLCRKKYSFGQWIEWDIDQSPAPTIPLDVLEKSVIICSDVIEHLINPSQLILTLKKWLKLAPAAVLSTPDRDLVRGVDDKGPPANTAHVREWNKRELTNLLSHYGLYTEHVGYTLATSISTQKKTILAVVRTKRIRSQHKKTVPPNFRILALMTTYNDEDIIIPVLSNLLEQGVDVYVIDNWSSDRTWQRLHEFQSKNPGVVGIERYPESASNQIAWEKILKRKEQLALEIPANWYIHAHSDEIPVSSWQNCSLREAIYRVDQEGFNAIDFAVADFYPTTSEDFPDQANPEDFFQYFQFGYGLGYLEQINAWKKHSQQVDLASSGGHDVHFDGRIVYPYKFLLKRYPIRSQSHGEQKIFRDQSIRTEMKFMEKGWHHHDQLYQPGHQFYKPLHALIKFDDDFYSNFLVERISGIGINIDSH